MLGGTRSALRGGGRCTVTPVPRYRHAGCGAVGGTILNTIGERLLNALRQFVEDILRRSGSTRRADDRVLVLDPDRRGIKGLKESLRLGGRRLPRRDRRRDGEASPGIRSGRTVKVRKDTDCLDNLARLEFDCRDTEDQPAGANAVGRSHRQRHRHRILELGGEFNLNLRTLGGILHQRHLVRKHGDRRRVADIDHEGFRVFIRAGRDFILILHQDRQIIDAGNRIGMINRATGPRDRDFRRTIAEIPHRNDAVQIGGVIAEVIDVFTGNRRRILFGILVHRRGGDDRRRVLEHDQLTDTHVVVRRDRVRRDRRDPDAHTFCVRGTIHDPERGLRRTFQLTERNGQFRLVDGMLHHDIGCRAVIGLFHDQLVPQVAFRIGLGKTNRHIAQNVRRRLRQFGGVTDNRNGRFRHTRRHIDRDRTGNGMLVVGIAGTHLQ